MPDYGYNAGSSLFRDAWAATRSYQATKIIEDIERAHPLLDKMAGKGNISAKEGGVGKRNVELILARVNKNIRWVSFDAQISATNTSLLEQIEWDWKFCYQDFVMNDKVLSINSSDEIANLLEINQRAVRMGFARGMAEQLYSAGQTSGIAKGLEMGGLQYLLSQNPYEAGTIVLNLLRGGNPGDRYEFWRNRAGQWIEDLTPSGGTKYSGTSPVWIRSDKDACSQMLVDAMRKMVMTLNTVNNNLDGIYMNSYFYDLYVYYMQKRLHINNVAGEKKDAGFMGVEFMQTPIYLDKYCPMNQIYFLDSSTLHFKYLKDENFKQEVRQLPDYFAKQYITTFIGNFIIERPRHNGVITLNTYNGSSSGGYNNDNGLPEDCNICNTDKFVDYDYPSIATVKSVSDTSIEKEYYSGSGVFRNDSVWSPTTQGGHDYDVDTNNGATKSYQPANPVQAPLNATKKSDKK